MFERYTELARRSIFFGRYEASILGASYIEAEHLLLGLIREDGTLRSRLPAGAAEKIRAQIEERAPQPRQSVATSVDMPLSQDSKRALTYAAMEAEELHHKNIDCWHLELGLLRTESPAAAMLRAHGIEYAGLRQTPPETLQARPPLPVAVAPLAPVAANLKRLLDSVLHLEEQSNQRLKRAPWSRKDALGHLIDWGAAHQQWFARALAGPNLAAGGYPEDGWLAAQNYAEVAWLELVELWSSLNRLLVHVIAHIPEQKIDVPCRIGIAEPIPLQELVRRYGAHCEDIIGQLLMRG